MAIARSLGATLLTVMTGIALLAGVEIPMAMMDTAPLLGATPRMATMVIVHSLGEIPPMEATEHHVSLGVTQFIVINDQRLQTSTS